MEQPFSFGVGTLPGSMPIPTCSARCPPEGSDPSEIEWFYECALYAFENLHMVLCLKSEEYKAQLVPTIMQFVFPALSGPSDMCRARVGIPL